MTQPSPHAHLVLTVLGLLICFSAGTLLKNPRLRFKVIGAGMVIAGIGIALSYLPTPQP